MDKYIVKLKNFWFYYKNHLFIALAVLAIAGYLAMQFAGAVEPDYHIGLVQSVPCSEEFLNNLETLIAAAGEDVNGDGEILVQIHTYFVDLADDSENAGSRNAEAVAALDADLVGHVSGIFLLEDREAFCRVTNNLLSDYAVPFADDLFLTLRCDADDAYITLAEKLS